MQSNIDPIEPILKRLLAIEQCVAKIHIQFIAQTALTIINDSDLIGENAKTQLVSDARASRSQIDNSNDPLSVSTKFNNATSQYLKKLGIDTLSF